MEQPAFLPEPPYFDKSIWGVDTWQLLSAAYAGDVRAVGQLLDDKPENIQVQFAYYEPLHYAVRGGSLPMVQLLLERGGHPMATGWSKLGDETPIAKANDRERIDMVELFKQSVKKLPGYKSPPERPQTDEQKLKYHFEIACGYQVDVGHVEQILNIHPEWATIGLYEAIHHGRINIIRMLLKAGANVSGHMPYACWFTPLMHALRYPQHHYELAELILENGLSVNSVNGLGISAIHIAIMQNDIDGFDWLLNRGADINMIEPESCSTPLGWAAKFNRPEMAKILLKRGADPGLPKVYPWATPVRWAEKKNHSKIVKLFK